MEKITNENNFHLVLEKVYELHSALMYCLSNELIKVPNSIVKVLYISQEGHLWFQCQVPAQLTGQYEHNFPVNLRFFRKGHGSFVTVSGNATIIKTLHHNPAPQTDITNN